MDKFRFKINIGSGLTVVEVSDNQLTLKVEKYPSPAVESKKLSGSIKFTGSTAASIFAYRTTNYYVEFSIEEYYSAAWHLLHTCNVDIRGVYEREKKVLTVSKFINKSGTHEALESGLKNKFKTNELGVSNSEINDSVTSSRLNVYSNPTSLSESDYRAAFSLEGEASPPNDILRWTFFEYYATTGSSSNLVHQYSARAFTYAVASYTEIVFQTLTYWVKKPPATYSNETLSVIQMSAALKFSDVLDALVSGIDSTLSYDSTDDGAMPVNTAECYIAFTNEFNGAEIEGIDITLGELFDFIKNYYYVSWYISSSKVKFWVDSFRIYDNTLDWSTETANWDNVSFAYNPMPDQELFAFQDETLDRLLISYFDKEIVTDNVLFDYTNKFYHDFFQLKKGSAPNNKLIWITAPSGNIAVKDPDDYWTDYDGTDEVFTEQGIYKIPTDPADAFTAVASSSLVARPIYSIKHQKWIDEYANFTVFNRIYLDGNTGNNTGYLNSYEIDLNTGIGTFDIWLNTLDI